MLRSPLAPPLLFLAFTLVAVPAAAESSGLQLIAVGAGVHAGIDQDEHEIDSPAFQLTYGIEIEPEVRLGVRAGRLGFDDERRVDRRTGVEIDYLTVAGEYLIDEPAWRSSFFIGVGGYRISGDPDGTVDDTATEIGLILGTNAEFELTRRLGLLLEVAAHHADFEDDQLFAQATAGLAWHF